MSTRSTSSILPTLLIVAAALLFAAALVLTGCGFVEEGGGIADTNHHRAPRPDGTQIDLDPDGPDDSSSDTSSGGTGHAPADSSDADTGDTSTTDPGETSDATSAGGSSSESSSTGELEEEPHCDASCPEADRLHNADAGNACVCAPQCETDDDCEGLALCNSTGVAGEQRCYIECDAAAQCPLDPPMQCRYYQGTISVCMWDGES